MGLIKERILSNGIPTRYHRIESALIDTTSKKIIVVVNSYVNEDVRTIERENQENKLLAEEINSFLDENIGTEDEEILNEIKIKTEQYNDLVDNLIDTSQFVVDINTYQLDYTTDISFEDIYNYLKTLDDFENAQDA